MDYDLIAIMGCMGVQLRADTVVLVGIEPDRGHLYRRLAYFDLWQGSHYQGCAIRQWAVIRREKTREFVKYWSGILRKERGAG